MFKAILIEVLRRIAVRTSMIWHPSSYAKLIQPTTQPKPTNPQPNPHTTRIKITYYDCPYLEGSTRNEALSVGLEVVKSVFLSSC